jgi:hypothetical protein
MLLYQDQGNVDDIGEVGVIPQKGKDKIKDILIRNCGDEKYDFGDLKCLRDKLHDLAKVLQFK